MRTIQFLAFLIAALLLNSCTQFKDGRYIIIKTSRHDASLTTLPWCSENSDSGQPIYGFLKQKFLQRKFNVSVKDDYVVLRDLDEGEDIILAFDRDSIGTYYQTEISKGDRGEQFKLQLRANSKTKGLILVIDLLTPQTLNRYPAQFGGTTKLQQCGRAICYMSKLD